MQGNLARPVWGWGPGEIPGPTPLFCGSERGAQAAAIYFSLIASCHRHGIDAFAYLRDVLKELPKLGCKPSQAALLPLLPDRWGKQ